MNPQDLIEQLKKSQEFFLRSTSSLQEKDSSFRPTQEMHTAAEQMAHVAQIIEWFMQGALRPEGFRMDWEAMAQELKSHTSLEEARGWVVRAYEEACATLASMSPAELMMPIAEGEIMGGAPRFVVVSGIEDHSAHHRGSLSVYARLCGHVPPMPYM